MVSITTESLILVVGLHTIDNSVAQDNNDWHLYELTMTNTDRGSTWLDGVSISDGHTGANNNYRPKRMQFSGWDGMRNGNREVSQCQIAEFITLNRVVTDAERLKIQGYLARKWGLMNTMFTASHPYFSNDPYQPTITQGGEDATVTFYWGDNNGSNVASNWDHNQQLSGSHGIGTVSHSLTGLTKGTTYYYTTKVSNSGGDVWGEVKSFIPANTALNKDTISDWLFGWMQPMSMETEMPIPLPMVLPLPLGRTSPTPEKRSIKLPDPINLFIKQLFLEPNRAYASTE